MNELVTSVNGISMVKVESYLLDRPNPDYEIASLVMESVNAYGQKISEIYMLNQFLEKADTERENLERNNRSLTELVSLLQDGLKEKNEEIERLKECPKCVYEYTGEMVDYCSQSPCPNFKTVDEIKAEAIKEFADNLCRVFAGHSDYHGDTILAKIICSKEGKPIQTAKPIDTSKIKYAAIKEFAERLKAKCKQDRYVIQTSTKFGVIDKKYLQMVDESDIDETYKEMVGDSNV